ncbi:MULTISPECIES: helix-turn-helix transcriptional regulator [unclassified Candidatus Frackibacter]|uniref:helix-turn-helix transcriptional regulator n=1 Tax=unclassified Candidatus Frackibacter TaxID=2648818 RepID=UPI000889DA98|nr:MULTISPECIES: helix-turn-helix transcriptional regulator [unclassified Candidatus Frackibacter]SDC31822.1 Helix-turn-helix [Candidatus Frackibacter sp. WG11]SEM73037.1 Helix-turn-helix [Candidatus Frackibacter sp. WG12]SFL59645.1 Helix-turn-helix [Candidatus Frackibacter sp. WG13]
MIKLKDDSSFENLKENVFKDEEEKEYYESMQLLRELQKLIIGTRIKAGLSQAELANKLNTTQSCISRLESGDEFNPEFKTLVKLVHVLNENIENDDEFYEAFKEIIKNSIQEAAVIFNKNTGKYKDKNKERKRVEV